MSRSLRLALVGLVILSSTGQVARSQYYHYPYGRGYGGYGFGGWGTTPVGDIARGYGAYARGAGVYNYDTAVANSINTDTVVRYNQYIYNSMLEGRRQYAAYEARKFNHDKVTYDARKARIRDNPDRGDIESGDALNVILDQLTDPKVMHGSALRMANGSLSPATIKEIPFFDETDAVTLSLDHLTAQDNWPFPLRADGFKGVREDYQKVIDDALAEDKEGGTLNPKTVARVRNSVARLRDKVTELIPITQQPDHLQAMNYVNGLAGLSNMLEKPNIEALLADLEKVQTTTAGNLIAFMHSYNLRFGPATTPQQKAIYRDLFAVMDQSRDQILGKPGAPQPQTEATPPPPAEDSHALFQGMDPTHLYPKPVAGKP